MKNSLTPEYLSDLVPCNVGSNSNYTLRNSQDSVSVRSRTSLYSNSFLPSAIREWNNLPIVARHSTSLSTFKSWLNRDKEKCPSYLYRGCRKLQVLHTRLRTKCSSLNFHLHQKNIVQSPLCTCGSLESAYHYFFECRFYSNLRPIFLRDLSLICEVSLDTILHGNRSLNDDANCKIIDIVLKYIQESRRFHN